MFYFEKVRMTSLFPLQALLVTYGEDDFYAFCPMCGGDAVSSYDGEVEIDDYVGGNILFTTNCEHNGQYMICPTGYSGDLSELDKLVSPVEDGLEIQHSCSKRLTEEEAMEFAKKHNIKLSELLTEINNLSCVDNDTPFLCINFWIVGVLEITHVLYKCEYETEDTFPPLERMHKLDPHVFNLDDAHGQGYEVCRDPGVWYRGICSVCCREYDSDVYGD